MFESTQTESACQGGACSCAAEPAASRIPRPVASVNGVALHAVGEQLDASLLRQRGCTELLRQAAQQGGLLAPDDVAPIDGVISVAAAQAIEQLLERELPVGEPDEAACQRYYAAHLNDYCVGARLHLRHILFAVTAGVDVVQLQHRAQALLLQLRCANDEGASFAAAAGCWSNCPSGAAGGDLGWLSRSDCASEFAAEIFAGNEIGVLPRLVHSRFGLHVVEVLARKPGVQKTFDEVHPAVALSLSRQLWVGALQQYLSRLAGQSVLQGFSLDLMPESA